MPKLGPVLMAEFARPSWLLQSKGSEAQRMRDAPVSESCAFRLCAASMLYSRLDLTRKLPTTLGTDNEAKWQPVPSFVNLTRL